MERWRIICAGTVQHVGFRYTAYYLARSMELTGWVDNLEDGRVLLEVQGDRAMLRRFVLALKNRPHIRIAHMEIREIEPKPEENRFRVLGYS